MKTYVVEAAQTVTHAFQVEASSEKAARKLVAARRGNDAVKRLAPKMGPLVLTTAKVLSKKGVAKV